MARAWKRPSASLLLLLLAGACSDSSGPDPDPDPDPGTPGLTVVAGAGQTDTVDAILPQAVIVEVRDTAGYLLPGLIVRFQPLPDGTYLSVATLAGDFGALAADTTDADGRAGALVRLGRQTGTAGLQVLIPILGWADTVEFVVQAGAATTVHVEPPDTTVTVGASFAFDAWTADRYGHQRADVVTYQSLDSEASVTTSGLVTARGVGVARIVVGAAGLPSDTSRVTILPSGTIVASVPEGLAVVNLDGTGYQVLPIATADYQGRYPTWLGDTAFAAMDGRYYADLLRVSRSGAVHYLVQDTNTVVLEVWPQAARDASWIYFGGLVPNAPTSGISVWRVRPNGGDLERVSPSNEVWEGDTFPSPSPDGSRVAIATTRTGAFTLAIIDVSTGSLTPLGVSGLAPRWAPAGDTVAYLGGAGDSEIWLVSASGGGARRVSPAGRGYMFGIDWSPDRRWIIAYGPEGLELVEVATGQVLPLRLLPPGLVHPAWKP